jgi:hypothetical protein
MAALSPPIHRLGLVGWLSWLQTDAALSAMTEYVVVS